LNKIAIFFAFFITIIGSILVYFGLAKVAPISVILFTIVTLSLLFVSTQMWINKVPDVEKREEQTFKMFKYVGALMLALLIFMFICILLIFLMAK
jgi:uncharacterized membrane protein YkgB